MLPVAAELVRRGNRVRFYSFSEFAEKIRATGADFCACDAFLPKLTAQQAKKLARVSTTEMTLQDIRPTRAMDSFLDAEYAAFLPDAVYCDAVCFWGKLSAAKHGVPLVISTSTFAFNQLSSQYLRHSPRELCDLIFGLPKISRELKSLAPLGYRFKGGGFHDTIAQHCRSQAVNIIFKEDPGSERDSLFLELPEKWCAFSISG